MLEENGGFCLAVEGKLERAPETYCVAFLHGNAHQGLLRVLTKFSGD